MKRSAAQAFTCGVAVVAVVALTTTAQALSHQPAPSRAALALRSSGPPPTAMRSAAAPVADAAMRGDLAAVRALLDQGVNVNTAQGDGMTALHWAASRGDSALASVLLYRKASVTAITRIGAFTPLHIAAQQGNAAIVRLLLRSKADARAVNENGVSVLHLAAMAGDSSSVLLLLKSGADVNASEPGWGHTPLMVAADRGRAAAVRTLLAHGADWRVAAKTVDPMASAAQDRQAKQKRNAVLAQLRLQQGAEKNLNWQPNSKQVQTAVSAAREVELHAATAGAVAGVVDANRAEEARLAAQGGAGLDDDTPGYTELIGHTGGLTALLLAVREGHPEVIKALVIAGADINQPSGDHTTPLLMATINGQYDAAMQLIAAGADVNLASDAGATPLYGVLNKEWAPSTRTPQPAYQLQQKATYLDVMGALLKAKANPNARVKRNLWYTTYNRDNLRVDFAGATPFFRAAYATDVPAMKLLLAAGADPVIGTIKPVARSRRLPAAGTPRPSTTDSAAAPPAPPVDQSGLPPIPDGGLGALPILAAAGLGYGQGFAANDHRHVSDGWLPSIKFLVETLGADVNARDYNGYAPLHFAAARGDNELIKYLVAKGANVMAVARNGQTTVDMANGPVQRISPYLDTIALLESLGAKNNHKCISC